VVGRAGNSGSGKAARLYTEQGKYSVVLQVRSGTLVSHQEKREHRPYWKGAFIGLALIRMWMSMFGPV